MLEKLARGRKVPRHKGKTNSKVVINFGREIDIDKIKFNFNK